MKKSFKYRIKANRSTFTRAEEVLNLCRVLYNLSLEQRRNVWKYRQKSISANTQKKQLRDLKKTFPEFNKVPSQTLQDVIERVDRAFQGFFRRVKSGEKPGYPRFRGYNRYDSFTLKQAGWKLIDSQLIISKLGTFNIILHRPIEGNIKSVTIRKSASGKWYVCFSCDNVPLKPLPKTGKEIGIDMGCENFLVDSNGRKIDNPRFLKKSEESLKERQKILSRKLKGSHRRSKQRILVAKAHEKTRNQRNDFHFKIANQLVEENDTICIEKMGSFNSFRSLTKSMRDVAWFNFFNILRFKAEGAGKEVIEVPAQNTSQICSGCGEIVHKHLNVRIHNCPHCNISIERDFNSAINILRLGTSRQDFPVEALHFNAR